MTRNLNVEFVRVVSMLLIVVWHILFAFIPFCENGSAMFKHAVPLMMFFIPFHVNAFVMISGYCGITKLKGVFKIWKLVFSYLLLIAGLNLIAGWGYFDYLSLFFSLSRNPWWFMQIYVLLVLLAPTLLEPFLAKTSQRNLLMLIGCMMVIDVYFGYFCRTVSVYHGGYDLLHFVNMYLVGSYLRTLDVKHLSIKGHSLRASHFFVFFCGIILAKVFIFYLLKYFEIRDGYLDYNNPFNIALTICFFLWVLNLNKIPRRIQWVSSSVVAVYLLHEHPLVKDWLRVIFDSLLGYCNQQLLLEIALVIIFTLGIFVISVLIDKVRLFMMQKLEKGFIIVRNNCLSYRNQ